MEGKLVKVSENNHLTRAFNSRKTFRLPNRNRNTPKFLVPRLLCRHNHSNTTVKDRNVVVRSGMLFLESKCIGNTVSYDICISL